MDTHGWVNVTELISGVNRRGKYTLNEALLKQIVAEDSKGRYSYNHDHTKIKCCRGHSILWVIPELLYKDPPRICTTGPLSPP